MKLTIPKLPRTRTNGSRHVNGKTGTASNGKANGPAGKSTEMLELRGQIVTAIDLRRRLELPPREADQLPMNVVVRSEDGGAKPGW